MTVRRYEFGGQEVIVSTMPSHARQPQRTHSEEPAVSTTGSGGFRSAVSDIGTTFRNRTLQVVEWMEEQAQRSDQLELSSTVGGESEGRGILGLRIKRHSARIVELVSHAKTPRVYVRRSDGSGVPKGAAVAAGVDRTAQGRGRDPGE